MSVDPAAPVRRWSGAFAGWGTDLRAASPFFRYAAIIGVAEFLVGFVYAPGGLVLHAYALVACVTLYLTRPADRSRRILPALALVPMGRLLSLTMPLDDVPRWAWYALVGAPLLLGAVLLVWRLRLTWSELQLGWPRRVRNDAGMLATGLLLGLLGFLVGAGPVLVSSADGPASALLFAGTLTLFVAVPEELIFRGLLQRLAIDGFGPMGAAVIAIVYVTAYLTWYSVGVMLVMGLAGAIFMWAIQRGGSLWGAIAGHAALVLGASIVWPALLN